ncbi:Cell division protein FtsZ [compost metagenome]
MSLYEVNEAADIVASASDLEVNMIFGAVINENLKEEIMVTVIATGFEHKPSVSQPKAPQRPVAGQSEAPASDNRLNNLRPFGTQPTSDQLDIPTFLRNRGRNTDK